jgi:hypothetical protein
VLRYFILVVALLLERSALSPDLIRMASGAIRGPMRGHLRTPRLRSRALTRFARNRSQIDLSPARGRGIPPDKIEPIARKFSETFRQLWSHSTRAAPGVAGS